MAAVLFLVIWAVFGFGPAGVGGGFLVALACAALWAVVKRSAWFQRLTDAVLEQTALSVNVAAERIRVPKSEGGGMGLSEDISPFDVPGLMRAGRWNDARRSLQKMAYTMPRETEETRNKFKALMTTFAAQDPLYLEWIGVIRTVVREAPGIRQAEAKKEFLSELSSEEANYLLYFAAELGQVRREKKGNSYMLFPGEADLT